MIKLIGIDIDGTIMRKNKIHPDVIAALKKAREQGIKITIATGRNIKSIYKIIQKLELEDNDIPLIAQNGGQVFSFNPDGSYEFKYNIFFSKSESDLLFKIANKHHVQIFSYTNDEDLAYVNKKITPFVFIMGRTSQRKSLVYDFDHELKSPISKLIVYGKKEAMIKFRHEVEEHGFPVFAFSYVADAKQNVEVVPKGVNKGEGLKFVADMLGIKREEVMYFGDGENDLAAIRWAGVGIAMGNAHDHIKKEADVVADSIYEAGVAKEINKLLKNNR